MVIPLKQSTASQEIFLGKFVDATDGDTEESGLTINSVDIWLWKQGATARVNPAAGATLMSQGDYYFVADDTDTNTLGSLILSVHPSGARPVKQECLVYPANVYDSMFGSDKLQVDVNQVGGTTQTAGDNTVTINSIYTVVDTEVADIHTDIGTATTTINSIYGKVDTEIATATTTINSIYGNVDTEITSITTTINSIYTQTVGTTMADSIWDEVIEGTTTARQSTRLQNAALFGKLSGGGSTTLKFRNIADDTDRITATVDSNKNRTAMTLDSS